VVRSLFGIAVLGAALVVAVPTAHPDAARTRTELLGRSVRGEQIHVLERGDPDSSVKILVVGCIHGNEPAGIAVAERLESLPLPSELDLWVVEDANPDGVRAGTRTNANGIDLNRNFPWRWARRGAHGDLHYSGPSPLSEPESRALAALISRVRPQITIWFHQHLAVVDESGGNLATERRFASLVGLPLRRLQRYRGSAASWQNHRFPGTTAFVVELPAGSLTPRQAQRYAEAVAALTG
jgi:protein MpaA